jgi:hypothetical protein
MRNSLNVLVESLVPDARRGQGSALDEGGKLRPAEFRVDAGAESAVGARDDILRAEAVAIADDALGDQLGMLDVVGRVSDDAGNEDLALR